VAPPLAPLALQRWSVVEPIVARVAPARILEIGCGLGGFGARLAARYDYTGVEQDATSYATARPRIEAAGGRAVHGPFTDVEGSAFDLVCAFEVLEHIEDDQAALHDWAKLVIPGGSLLISVPAGPERYGEWDRAVGHYRRYDSAQLESVLAQAGLDGVQLTHYGWPLGFLTETVRNRVAKRRADGDAMADRTASSGRRLQPGQLAGRIVQVAATPFVALQARRPDVGVGVVAVARKPL
jgi:SAM-dependent methyltransferase